MKIYLAKTCGAFDYKETLFVETFKSDPRTKSNAIIIQHKNMTFTIPLANIVTIEE